MLTSVLALLQYIQGSGKAYMGTSIAYDCKLNVDQVDELTGRVIKAISEQVESNTNVAALLKECLTNGDAGQDQLFAWFSGERDVIDQVLRGIQ